MKYPSLLYFLIWLKLLDISNGGGGEMAWTASTSDSWLTITQGSLGTDSGRVIIDYSVNTGEPRTGTLTITSDSAFNSPQPVKILQLDIDED
ncbi:BACON domain-containing carbohydrate-binding protein, partial [Desulfobacterales bacterium HSG17]|nr:BACON domain-containing carbohydrate-binding protein [Desulfobacterales bacterium HSG17]